MHKGVYFSSDFTVLDYYMYTYSQNKHKMICALSLCFFVSFFLDVVTYGCRIATKNLLPRCSHVAGRYATVLIRFVPVHPASVPFHPGGVPVTAGPATVMPRCLSVLKMLVTRVNHDGTEVN